jgi:hypothetical protein
MLPFTHYWNYIIPIDKPWKKLIRSGKHELMKLMEQSTTAKFAGESDLQ